MSEEQPDDPKVLRREILAMLKKVTDRGSLLFFQWLLRRVYADMPLPGDAELKELRNAFVRVFDAFKVKKRPWQRTWIWWRNGLATMTPR